jgi:Zn-dependent M28 family amino/carboxypeptidase
MKKFPVFILLVFFFCQSCTNEPVEKASQTIRTAEIKKYVKDLGSDAFLGRKPFTKGEDTTLSYLQEQYRQIGLKPANNGSYLQDVPMVEVKVQPQKQMRFQTPSGEVELDYKDEFVAFSRKLTDNIKLDQSDVVFGGYGIVAPEYNWNDYEGIDVEGKTVVVFVNDPGYGKKDTDFFTGNAMTYYGRWTYKYEEAARQGAKGLLIIHETGPAGYPWSVVLNGAVIPKLYLKPDNGYKSRCALEGWLTYDAADKLFSKMGYNLSELKEQAKQPSFKPKALEASLSFEMKSEHSFDTSRNVIGYLPGKERKDEVLIYTAHWDHLGVDPTLEGDSIYNGAVDNGTTLAWMLEIAEAFASIDKPLKRSVMFLAPTAEEQGLIGAKYYVQNPLFPLEKTVADINNDLMLPYGRYEDVMITGYGQSELEDIVEKVAKKHDRYIYPDPNPQTGMFYRADHFAFAKEGVPALFARGNCDSRKHGKEWAKKKEQFWLENRYHKPSDEYNPKTWDLRGIRDDARLLFEVGYRIANDTIFPSWKEGSEFKDRREQMMKD